MGIPVYFKTLLNDYQDTILEKNKLHKVNSLFLDLNCLIHPCCQTILKKDILDETIMIQYIIDSIYDLIHYTNVQQLLYIAIDGVAPKGKMKQQKMRRYKNAHEKTNKFNITCILSDSTERGEGEHKILNYIRTNSLDLEGNKVIYGLDADLIMLALVSHQKNIYLLRERTEYNIENTTNEYIYLQIDPLKEHIIQQFPSIKKPEQIINDYIFICFLLGNDFINHIPSLNLRYNGHTILLDVYQLLQKRYQGYFRLIDTSLEHLIHLPFFKEFIHELSLKENYILQKTYDRRNKQHIKIYGQYHEVYNDFKTYYLSQIQHREKNDCTQTKNFTMEDIYTYQSTTSYDQEIYENMTQNLPLLDLSQEKHILHKKHLYYDNKEEQINDYILSLLWCTHYYFKGCIHWKWSTKYGRAPFLQDLSQQLQNYSNFTFEKDDKEFTIQEQLSYIFPQHSHQLHSYDLSAKSYTLIPDTLFRRYLWECDIDFITGNTK